METLEDLCWEVEALVRQHPLRWHHPNKQLVHQIVQDAGEEPAGRIRIRRWAPAEPTSVGAIAALAVTHHDGPFAYDDGDDDAMVFYPNFADHHLFGYWDGPLLAQDELQVAEHPVLGAVRQALVASGHATHTVDPAGQPTPFTLEGVARRVSIDVSPGPDRPLGLYGNRFAAAPPEVVRSAVQPVVPPTITNLVAMSAPACGRGRYTSEQIQWILTAAYTAFCATKVCAGARPVVLHTGFWGCGAFGGDHVLMAMLQLLAASAAGIERVVFHTFAASGRAHLAEAQATLAELSRRLDDDPGSWVVAITRMGFAWGVSDGN